MSLYNPDAAPQPPTGPIVPGEAPYHPLMIALAGALTGFITSGILVAINWERLYRFERKRPTLIAAGVAYGLLAVIVGGLYLLTLSLGVFFLGLGLNALGALAVSLPQRTAYDEWVARRGVPDARDAWRARLLLIAAVALFVQGCVIFPVATFTVIPAIRPLLADPVYMGEHLTFTYNYRWRPLNISDDPLCNAPDTTCLFALRSEDGAAALDIVRVAEASGDVEVAADALWALVEENTEGAALLSRTAEPVGGREAVQLVYTIPNPYPDDLPGESLRLERALVADGDGVIRFTLAITGEGLTAQQRADLEAIFDSMRFGG